MGDFSGWTKKRFIRWLHKNYPDPKTRWVQVAFAVHHTPTEIFEYTMADDYETCVHELAQELAMQNGVEGKEQLNFLMRPARRRKKKQMWLRTLK